MKTNSVQSGLKCAFDKVISTVGLVLFAIPFAFVALLIKGDSKGSVFFCQTRMGKNGRPFRVWKFRTMVAGAESQGLGYTVARDDLRITRVGRILRNCGFDELPQLINVLKGEMSLVGPRPTLPYQIAHYDAEQQRRLAVRPGITSVAVISGRNALPWRKRIELDLWYVDHWSFGLDLWILLKTFWVVLITRRGLYGEDGINDPFVSPPKGGPDAST
jgi:lipopolysaccharide/colanic/teichoic acid biosynthesis glycosyltransferase